MWLAAVAAALGAGGCHHAEKAAPDAVQGAPRATEAHAASIAASAPPEPSAAPSASVVASASATPSASAVKPAPTAPDLAILAALGADAGFSGLGTLNASCGGIASTMQRQRNICGLARSSMQSNSCGASSSNSLANATPTATITLNTSGAKAATDDRILAQASPRLRLCANRALQSNPTEQGKMIFELVVGPSGEVSRVDTRANTGLSASSAACMQGVLRRLQFEAGSSRTLMVAVTQTHS
jgi:hypothetical protein